MAERPLVPIESIGEGKSAAAAKTLPDAKDHQEESDLRNSRDHELAIMRTRMGPIGRLVGSEDTALTISFFVLTMCFGLLVLATVVSVWNASVLAAVGSDLFKVILTVAGYIFGKLQSRNTR